MVPSNAHPPFRPATVTAVKMPLGPALTRLTMCQDGTEIGAATAACAQPATAVTAAASSAARRTLTFMLPTLQETVRSTDLHP